MFDATKPRCLIAHTPHTLAVLTPTHHCLVPLPFASVLTAALTSAQQQQLQHALDTARALPVDLALSASVLPIAQHTVPAPLHRLNLQRFLRHHYPSHVQRHGYCVRLANQRTHLLSCGIATNTLRALLRFWRQWQLTPRAVAPLACLVPGTFSRMPGTHLLLFNSHFERSLAVIVNDRLQAVINRDASFEELFRHLTHHAPQCAWEQGIDLLTTPAPQTAALNYAAWLDAWYWFAE